MHRLVSFGLAFGVASALVTSSIEFSEAQGFAKFRARKAGPATGRYVVVLQPGTHADLVAEVAAELGGKHRGKTKHLYRRALKGFAIAMTETDARNLSADPRVAFVEEDTPVTATAVQSDVDWGLDRIDQRKGPGNGTYSYDADGRGVHIYVIDSGVRASHTEFAPSGRVSHDFSTYPADSSGGDCYGHGSAVASVAAGVKTGVAKAASIHSIRVLNCEGTGYWSDAIRGIEWVTANHVKPAVANMSISGERSSSVQVAIEGALDAGVTFVAAAGNANVDACTQSPGFVQRALIVGNVDQWDVRYPTSNFGSCVDLYAPGTEIRAAHHSGDAEYRYVTGTSLSSPYVAGAAALYLQRTPDADPAEVMEAIANTATALSNGSLMLYAPALGDRTPPTVGISAPASGAAVSGDVTVTATAADNLQVASVEFYVGGTLISTDLSAPYTARWVTTSMPDGSYALTATAIDISGNVTTSASRTVAVKNGATAVRRNAFATIEAESYDAMAGIRSSSTYIGYVDGGDWAKYSAVDFGTGATSVATTLAVSASYAGKQIQFRLGSPAGTLIGTLTVASTGGWYTFVDQKVAVTKTTGVHDLYLVAAGGAGVGNIDAITFSADTTASSGETGELSVSGWTASASASYSPASRAIDRNSNYKWQNGRSQASSNDHVQVDLGAAKAFNRIVLDHTGNINDYPASYRVDVSDNGSTWTTVATGKGTPTATSITLPATYTKRYVRVTETGSTGGYWFTVNEFRVFHD